jgi:hypothetical protein
MLKNIYKYFIIWLISVNNCPQCRAIWFSNFEISHAGTPISVQRMNYRVSAGCIDEHQPVWSLTGSTAVRGASARRVHGGAFPHQEIIYPPGLRALCTDGRCCLAASHRRISRSKCSARISVSGVCQSRQVISRCSGCGQRRHGNQRCPVDPTRGAHLAKLGSHYKRDSSKLWSRWRVLGWNKLDNYVTTISVVIFVQVKVIIK